MRLAKKRESEQRAKLYMLLTVAKIVAQITIILGFFLFVYYLVLKGQS